MKIGKIVRPENGDGDATVTLTAEIKKGSVTATKLFTVVIKEQGLSDTQCVAADKAALDIVGKTNVTANLILPFAGDNGTAITWSSGTKDVISDAGIVTRPANGDEAVDVVMTATITKGTSTDTKAITCTVQPWTDSEEVDLALAALVFDTIRGTNSGEQSIIANLNLSTAGERDTTIAWSSTSTAISNAGVVTRPDYSDGDSIVSLTATITKGAETRIKQFLSLKVVKLPQTNMEAVTAALAGLTEADILGSNTNLQNIISNLILPKSPAVEDDAPTVSFSWSQKKTGTQNASIYLSIVDGSPNATGQVTRPPVGGTSEDIDLTVTAISSSATGSSNTQTKLFNIKILKATS